MSILASSAVHADILEDFITKGQIIEIVDPMTGCYKTVSILKYTNGIFFGMDPLSSIIMMFKRDAWKTV